jgi:hypothetical protein
MADKLDLLHDRGKINDYMFGLLSRSQEAMDMELWDESLRDAVEASMSGVNNDKDYQVWHYIDTFVEDLIGEIFGQKLSDAEEALLKKHMFEIREEIDYNNLVSFLAAIVLWLKGRKGEGEEGVKTAYPNRGGQGRTYLQKQNMVAWSKLAAGVRNRIRKGEPENAVLSETAGVLHPRERLDFIAWYRFKYGKFTSLYDVNHIIEDQSEGTMKLRPNKKAELSVFAFISETDSRYYLPQYNAPYMALDEKEEKEETADDILDKEKHKEYFQEARSKLISRTFAIDKLLERYHEAINAVEIGEIEDALNALRKKIRALKCASIVRDTVIKTANIVRSKGFSYGAVNLELLAYDFTGQKETIIKEAFEGMRSADIPPIINELSEIVTKLRRRDMIRDIAKLDFKLHDMNASALFPELAEAMSKLVDATTYASNKVNDVIPKLRSITQGPDKTPGIAPGGGESPSPAAPSPTPTPPKTPSAPTPPTPTPTPATPEPAPAPPPAPMTDFEKAI